MAKVRKGFALLGTVLPKLGRVRTFGEDSQRVRTFVMGSQRVRTFGHGLAKNSEGFALLVKIRKGFALLSWIRKGFALLGTTLPETQKGSRFCAGYNQNFERVHTFGEGSQRVRTFG